MIGIIITILVILGLVAGVAYFRMYSQEQLPNPLLLNVGNVIRITNVDSGESLYDPALQVNTGPIELSDNKTSDATKWTYTADGTLKSNSGLCLTHFTRTDFSGMFTGLFDCPSVCQSTVGNCALIYNPRHKTISIQDIPGKVLGTYPGSKQVFWIDTPEPMVDSARWNIALWA